ncbi:hypothetical protein Thiowin_01969 [Thiorhodovibrio winogradskyi]|uniref:Uncharacterized protein n=1 Tax=Thiorhodovibrio winogradskyi TaxID=77007 RepID=A0ABZ0S981_9GAMM|nr:hypothetical protein [Thiorhodovibrio winogradskyi]
MAQKAPDGWGQGRALRTARKQSRAERPFLIADTRAHRRLDDMQTLGGFEKASVGGDGEERLDLIEIHDKAQSIEKFDDKCR